MTDHFDLELEVERLTKQNAELVAHSNLLKQQFGLALDMLEKYLLRDDHLTGDDASDFAEFQHYLESAPTQHLRDIQAEAVNTLQLDEYDAGFLNDFGGGNVGWWQDYIRSELGSAYNYYQVQIQQYAAKCLREIQAKAGRTGFVAGYSKGWNDYAGVGRFRREELADEYAAKVRQGGE